MYRSSLLFISCILLQFFTTVISFADEPGLFHQGNPLPGDPFTVYIYPYVYGSSFLATFSDASGKNLAEAPVFPVRFSEEVVVGAAILSIPITGKPGKYFISLLQKGNVLITSSVEVPDKLFAEEKVILNTEMTTLRTVPDKKKDQESAELYAILMKNDYKSVFNGDAFTSPVPPSRISSEFGLNRTYVYSDGKTSTTYHYGIDYAVPVGTLITASGTGRVVLARSRILTGNTIVIEHMPGIYSLYYHLDSIDVREGDYILQGKTIGRSGKTGLVTGPHLHFEFRVNGIASNPDTFIDRGLIDKSFILSIICSNYP